MDLEAKPSGIRFLADSTEGKDGAKEAIMDYVISWMLRCAQTGCCDDKPILHSYCRLFLGHLLGLKLNESDIVTVETWKQYGRIDLWVYVRVNDKEHEILIEDKYYTGVHDNQLERYRRVFEDWHKNHNQSSILHYWLLNCFDNRESTHIYNDVIKNGVFSVLFWDEMLESMGLNITNPRPSESDIFNEFWLETW